MRAAPHPRVRSSPVNIDDLILVSVDDHVVEPPAHVRRPPAGEVPATRRRGSSSKDDGTDVWVYEGQEMRATSASTRSPAARPRSTASSRRRFDEMRPGCYDIHERVARHERQRRARRRCASRRSRSFCGQLFAQRRRQGRSRSRCCRRTTTGTSTSGAARTRAASSRSRSSPLWDPQLMAAEVRRMAAKGCHAVTFSENPEKLGLPSFHSDHWDPFWQACERRGHDRVPAHRLVVAARRSPPSTRRSTC